ncbi:MAG TPA: VCBS repeat-containing protein [Bacteroidota bacterium]|nr:VCBS repeat-containing protein [Bacteroidota bacterium]
MSTPSFVDIDNDGDLDLLVGAEDAPLMQFFVNQGSNVFVADNGTIAGVTSVRDGHPHFVDLDRDGDYDLLIGGSNGRLPFYENTGSPLYLHGHATMRW